MLQIFRWRDSAGERGEYSVRHLFSFSTGLFDITDFSLGIALLDEEGFKGHRPKKTVEMMLASTLPLVGQR